MTECGTDAVAPEHAQKLLQGRFGRELRPVGLGLFELFVADAAGGTRAVFQAAAIPYLSTASIDADFIVSAGALGRRKVEI